jgi:TPM domain
MSRRVHCLSLSVLAAWLALAAPAGAVAPEIRDEGKFFSPEAVKKANEQIRDLFAKYGKDLLIESFASVPADKLDKVKAMTSAEKTDYFHKQAVERARQRVVKGVYVLITREPTFLYIEITPDAREVFATQPLREVLLSNFREKRFDEGLAALVKAVQEKLEKASSR